jgi:hypothetical protein
VSGSSSAPTGSFSVEPGRLASVNTEIDDTKR